MGIYGVIGPSNGTTTDGARDPVQIVAFVDKSPGTISTAAAIGWVLLSRGRRGIGAIVGILLGMKELREVRREGPAPLSDEPDQALAAG